jgi:MinD-like ATPase involved in chromosome partitioning or flagellar assembly
MTAVHDGEIVTFYSYKGGTGRTMALANIAWILAANGCRVLAVDWDLEAPGLHKFFRPFLDEESLTKLPGLLNLIMDFGFRATELGPDNLPPDDDDAHYDHFAQLDGAELPIRWEFGDGSLDLLPAGRLDRSYTGSYSSFDWNHFHERLRGAAFFRALRRSMKRSYDYVLIDSRTGLSDAGDICTALIPDTLVNCFTMSEQSIEGAAMVARRISGLNRERTVRILPVPMRLEVGEKERLDIGRATAQVRFDQFLGHLPDGDRTRYWRSVEVPYVPYYSYEEILAVFADLPGATNTVLGAFERVTAEITQGKVSALPPIREDLRQHHLRAFQRPRPAPPADIRLSYVAEDRPWADWIMAVLQRAGYRVSRRSLDAETADARGSTDPSDASRTVAVLSRSYVGSAECRAVEDESRRGDPLGSHRLVVPISVGGPAFANPLPVRATVDLDQLDEEGAYQVVLAAVGGEVLNAGQEAAGTSSGPRFPGSNPPIWRVPARNENFTGRAELLETLRDQLLEGGSAALLQVLHGLGGVGKTQIALEYAHRFKSDYDIVWWIPSEEPNRVTQLLADLAIALGVRSQSANVEDAARAVLDLLRAGGPGKRALLVFDNVEARESFDVLKGLIPTGGAAHVLITSRDRAPAAQLGTTALDVNVFNRDESVAHLLAHVPHLSDADAHQLAEQLGDLPIVIELAAAWLRETGRSAASYSKELADNPEIVLSEASGTYEQPVSAVWRATIEQLRERSAAAVRMLELCAFFGPEPISEQLIYSKEFVKALTALDPLVGDDRMMVGRLVRQLTRFALARVDHAEKGVQIHRLLQSLVRDGMESSERASARLAVQRILAEMRPTDDDVENPENEQRYQILWPHLYECHADRAVEGGPRQLMIDRVRFLRARGQLGRALELAERMAQEWAGVSPADDMWLLRLRFEIANVKREQGDAASALAIDEDVHELQWRSPEIGPDHLHTLRTAGSLAADLRSLGKWRAALERDRKTCQLIEDEYGERDKYTLNLTNNLAVSLRINGQPFEARDVDERVYRIRREDLGEAHPSTLSSATSLGRDLRDCGQLSESLALLQTTVAVAERAHGEEHPMVLRAARSLAITERRLGRHRDAYRRTEQYLDRFRRVFGDSPETLACELSHAANLSASGNVAEAKDLTATLLAKYVARFGAEHPHTLACANNLAVQLLFTGPVSDAVDLATDTHRSLTERLGTDHPFTMACAGNLASELAEAGKHSEALELSTMTAKRLARVLGERHPDTIDARANQAVVLHRSGRRSDADALRSQLLDLMGALYDDDHQSPDALRRWQVLGRDLEPHST